MFLPMFLVAIMAMSAVSASVPDYCRGGSLFVPGDGFYPKCFGGVDCGEGGPDSCTLTPLAGGWSGCQCPTQTNNATCQYQVKTAFGIIIAERCVPLYPCASLGLGCTLVISTTAPCVCP